MTIQISAAKIPFKQAVQTNNTNTLSKPVAHSPEDKNEKNDNKLALSLAALATIGAGVLAATMAYKKGKVQGIKTAAQTVTENLTQTVENSKNIDLALFRKIGSFENRKAIIKGKPFTGQIHTDKATLVYKDGVLQQSHIGNKVKTYGKLNNKTYVTIKSGDGCTNITKSSGGGVIKKTNNGRDKIIKYIGPDGTTTIREVKTDINGKIVEIDKTVCLNNKKTSSQTLGKKIYSAPFYKKQEIVNGQKVTNTYSPDGKILYSDANEYNPKTGVLKITTKHYDKECTDVILKQKANGAGNQLSGTLDSNGKLENIYIMKDGEYIPEMLHGTAYYKDVRPVSLEKARELIKKHGLPFEI